MAFFLRTYLSISHLSASQANLAFVTCMCGVFYHSESSFLHQNPSNCKTRTAVEWWSKWLLAILQIPFDQLRRTNNKSWQKFLPCVVAFSTHVHTSVRTELMCSSANPLIPPTQIHIHHQELDSTCHQVPSPSSSFSFSSPLPLPTTKSTGWADWITTFESVMEKKSRTGDRQAFHLKSCYDLGIP